MAPWAVCAECNTRYEAGVGFCPRCGSTAQASSAEPQAPNPLLRRDPNRMRLQLGGILLLLVGGIFVASASFAVLDPVAAEEALFQYYADAQALGQGQGGDLELHVARGAEDVAGANVTVRADNATVANGTTGPDGRFNASLAKHPAVVVNVTQGGQAWERRVLVPAGLGSEVEVDLGTDASSSDRVVGAGKWSQPLAVASLALSLFLVLGGLAAVLVRWRGVALAGPLPTVVLTLLFVVAAFNMGTLLFVALVGVPYALVLSGRSAFRRR